MIGAYAGQPHDRIVATTNLLNHFRLFLNSPCREMRDPYEVTEWRDGAVRFTKDEARARLAFLIHVAINRKAGVRDEPLNHRGQRARRWLPDHQLHLRRDRSRLLDMARRIRVYQFETDEVRARFGHRLATHDDC